MRILYITLYAPPFNSIPSQRTQAFLNYFPHLEVEVDVLTRHYDQPYLKGDDFFITYSPIQELKYGESYHKDPIVYSYFEQNTKVIQRHKKLPPILSTLYAYVHQDLYHEKWTFHAMRAFEEHLSTRKYDFIVGSYHPMINLVLAKKLSKKYNVPWIAEFRDPFVDAEKDSFLSVWYKKTSVNQLLRGSQGVIGICDGILQQVLKHCPNARAVPKKIVNNGVDTSIPAQIANLDMDIVQKINQIQEQSSLLLLHTGTIYEGQNISFFIDLIKNYNLKHEKPISLVCVGLTKDQMHSSKLNFPHIFVFEKVQTSTSLFLQRRADVLILPAWYTQRYTGFVAKIFEYIYSGSSIICSPKPPKDLNEFISAYSNVFVAEGYLDTERHIHQLIQNKSKLVKTRNNHPSLTREFWIHEMRDFLIEQKKK